MKKFFLLSILFILIGCIPAGYKIYIVNNSGNDILIITKPSIEFRLNLKEENKMMYDSIIAFKQNTSDDRGVYLLKPQNKIMLFRVLGKSKPKDFPFKEVQILKNETTINIGKNNFEKLITNKIKTNYYINFK